MSNLRNNFAPIFCWHILHRSSFAELIGLWSISALVAVGLSAAPATAQETIGAARSTSAPVAYASVSELHDILTQLQQTAQSIQTDLGEMRVEKWKTDGATRKQALSDSDSIRRNLQSMLPETIAQLNNSPEDVGVSFKLYRDLDALYDVFGSVAELAGAFGSKDESQSLGNDLNGLQSARRALGERLQKLAGAKEEELTRLRSQVKTLSAAPPPKKIIVDDTEPAKKPVKKKTVKPGTSTKPSVPANPPVTASAPSK